MTIRQLHPDWPSFDTAEGRWDMAGPMSDLAVALTESPDFGTATAPSVKTEGFQLSEIDRIVRYHVAYYNDVWSPTNPDAGGTELEMFLVGQLADGRWFSLVAGNDYTGWGCQDWSDFRIGDTEEQVVEFGLDESGRILLGYAGGEL